MEEASRACGIIERSWIHYAVEMLQDSELATSAYDREDAEEISTPPPYQFMVGPMLYAYLAFDADGMHLLDDKLERAHTFGT